MTGFTFFSFFFHAGNLCSQRSKSEFQWIVLFLSKISMKEVLQHFWSRQVRSQCSWVHALSLKRPAVDVEWMNAGHETDAQPGHPQALALCSWGHPGINPEILTLTSCAAVINSICKGCSSLTWYISSPKHSMVSSSAA